MSGFLPQIPQKDADALLLYDRVTNISSTIEFSATICSICGQFWWQSLRFQQRTQECPAQSLNRPMLSPYQQSKPSVLSVSPW